MRFLSQRLFFALLSVFLLLGVQDVACVVRGCGGGKKLSQYNVCFFFFVLLRYIRALMRAIDVT